MDKKITDKEKIIIDRINLDNVRCWTENYPEANRQAWIQAEKEVLFLKKENAMLRELNENHSYWVAKAQRLEKELLSYKNYYD